MRKALALLSMVVLTLILFIRVVHAQTPSGLGGRVVVESSEEPAKCMICDHNLDTDEHWFPSGGGECTGPAPCMDCVAFNACHSNPQHPFACGYYHWVCGAAKLALEAVDKALQQPDPRAAIVIAVSTMPKQIEVESAGYVVVKGCRGEIVAAYKVPADGRLSGVEGTATPRQVVRTVTSLTRTPFVQAAFRS